MAKPRIAFPNKPKPGAETAFEKQLPVVLIAKGSKGKNVCLAVIKDAANAATAAFVSIPTTVPISARDIFTGNLPLKPVAVTDDCTLFALVLTGPIPLPKDFHPSNAAKVKVVVHA